MNCRAKWKAPMMWMRNNLTFWVPVHWFKSWIIEHLRDILNLFTHWIFSIILPWCLPIDVLLAARWRNCRCWVAVCTAGCWRSKGKELPHFWNVVDLWSCESRKVSSKRQFKHFLFLKGFNQEGSRIPDQETSQTKIIKNMWNPKKKNERSIQAIRTHKKYET